MCWYINKHLEFLKFLCGGDCPLAVLRPVTQYRHVGYRIAEEFAASIFRAEGGGVNVNLVDTEGKPTNAYTLLRVSYITNIVTLNCLYAYSVLIFISNCHNAGSWTILKKSTCGKGRGFQASFRGGVVCCPDY